MPCECTGDGRGVVLQKGDTAGLRAGPSATRTGASRTGAMRVYGGQGLPWRTPTSCWPPFGGLRSVPKPWKMEITSTECFSVPMAS